MALSSQRMIEVRSTDPGPGHMPPVGPGRASRAGAGRNTLPGRNISAEHAFRARRPCTGPSRWLLKQKEQRRGKPGARRRRKARQPRRLPRQPKAHGMQARARRPT